MAQRADTEPPASGDRPRKPREKSHERRLQIASAITELDTLHTVVVGVAGAVGASLTGTDVEPLDALGASVEVIRIDLPRRKR